MKFDMQVQFFMYILNIQNRKYFSTSKMAADAILKFQKHALIRTFVARFWCHLIHRFRSAWQVESYGLFYLVWTMQGVHTLSINARQWLDRCGCRFTEKRHYDQLAACNTWRLYEHVVVHSFRCIHTKLTHVPANRQQFASVCVSCLMATVRVLLVDC